MRRLTELILKKRNVNVTEGCLEAKFEDLVNCFRLTCIDGS